MQLFKLTTKLKCSVGKIFFSKRIQHKIIIDEDKKEEWRLITERQPLKAKKTAKEVLLKWKIY